jgi:hypothetical protein
LAAALAKAQAEHDHPGEIAASDYPAKWPWRGRGDVLDFLIGNFAATDLTGKPASVGRFPPFRDEQRRQSRSMRMAAFVCHLQSLFTILAKYLHDSPVMKPVSDLD